MVLELHVWGPAFGLPSIDAECIAIITYFVHALPQSEWRLVASSPSAVPSHVLPALKDSSEEKWISGFRPIVTYVKQLSSSADLDRELTAGQRADTAAYAAFLTTHALPLIALSLYVSSANWAATSRPAYSSLLPFPLTWTEPLQVRSALADKAAHLGLSSLDTDSDPSEPTPQDGSSLFFIPQRLRPLPRAEVSSSLTPEQKARIRLASAAMECLDVLADLKGEKSHFLSDERVSSLDCLVFGYLALMLLPEVPRPWLREVMVAQHGALCEFVKSLETATFEGRALPWVSNPAQGVSLRFLSGAVQSIPGVGDDVRRWMIWRQKDHQDDPWEEKRSGTRDLITAVGIVATCSALVAGVMWYRSLPRFGSPLYQYHRVRSGLPGLGAAGTGFEIPADFWPGNYTGGGGGEPRAFTGSTSGISSGFEEVTIEMGGKASVTELDVNLSDVD